MDNEAFYFEKDTIEYKVPFSQVQNIKAKHFPSRKWRVLLYSITIYYKNKQGQTKKIYFISTDQQNNYTLDSFFSFKDIPFVSELKEHIQLHSK